MDYSEIYGGSESSEASIGLKTWWSQLKRLAKSAEWWHDGDYGEHKFRDHWEQYQADMEEAQNLSNNSEGEGSE